MVTVVNVGYRSTNYWVVSAGVSRILVDLGWPGTMAQMRAKLDRAGVPLPEIRYGFATHYHPDHAGLAQEFKLAGVPLLVVDVQVAAVSTLGTIVKPRDGYVDVTMHDNVTISCKESRPLLKRIGIDGELLETPGHHRPWRPRRMRLRSMRVGNCCASGGPRVCILGTGPVGNC